MITQHLMIPADDIRVEVIDQVLDAMFDLLDVLGTSDSDFSVESTSSASSVLLSFLNHHSAQGLRPTALILAKLGAGGLMLLLNITG